MESNPYAAPAAVVDDVRPTFVQDLESRKASRGSRLGAALLDSLINAVWLVPLVLGAGVGSGSSDGSKGLLALGILLLFVMFVVNCMMIHKSGQTIGKRALNIAIWRTDGELVGLGRYIFRRVLPVALVGMIPMVGRLAAIVDVLFIFGAERRCLHDLIAETVVVDV